MSGFIPLDAVANPEYKRYRFEGTRPYKKWIKFLSGAALLFGLLFLGAVALITKLVLQLDLPEFLPWIERAAILGIIALSFSAFGFIAFAFMHFLPFPAAPLFKAGTPAEVKKLGLKLARSWDKAAPKFFAGLQDPIRKHLFYPGLIWVAHSENQLIMKVKVPAAAVAGGIEEYAKAAAQEMEHRLRIPVKAAEFYHDTYVNAARQKTKPDEDYVMFVLTPVDYSLKTREVVLR